MKVTVPLLATISALIAPGVSAYGGSFIASKNALRSVGKRGVTSSGSSRKVGSSIKMEGRLLCSLLPSIGIHLLWNIVHIWYQNYFS